MRGFIRSAALIAAITLAATACGEDTSTTTAAPAGAVQTSPSSEAPAETPSSTEAPVEDMGHEDMGHDDMGHDDMVEAPVDAIPTINIDVTADVVGGYNVTIETTSFVVRPDLASTEHVAGSGHYHLWVDGKKILRFYNDAIHVALEPGMHEVGVELSANTHASYAVDGEVIAATAMVDVPGDPHDADHDADHDAGDDNDHEAHGHDHAAEVDVSGIASAPSLELTVHEDPKAGYNVEIDVQNLTLSAEHASGDHVLGEGHLHLYVDGDKVGRLYGGWTHVGLDGGDHVVEVRAFTNDHRAYVVDGVPIAAAKTITVPAG